MTPCHALRCERCARLCGELSRLQADHPALRYAVHPAADCDALVVAARYDEDVAWLRAFRARAHVVLDKRAMGVPNAGGDGSSYLWFLLHFKREALPSWVLFMHGHETAWHHPTPQTRSMLIDMNRTGLLFLNINHRQNGTMLSYDEDAMEGVVYRPYHERLRKELLHLNTPYRGSVHYPCCGQFWVHRSLIVRRPADFYRKIYEAVTTPSNPLYQLVLGYKPSVENRTHLGLGGSSLGSTYLNRTTYGNFFLENYWHTIFLRMASYPYRLPVRNYTRLPLISAEHPRDCSYE
eukprot:3072478-Prymnesium_polylepis.1